MSERSRGEGGLRASHFGALLFGAALALRLACLFGLRWYEDAAGPIAWNWGFEAANVAHSVASGGGFADPWIRPGAPFDQHSGPTGWLAPAYPSLIAGLMRLFGTSGPGLAVALLVVQSALSSLTCLFVWRIGVENGFARVGRWGGWLLALHPYAVWSAAHTVWDTTLVACALSAFVWLGLRARANARTSAGLGAAYGALLLVNPAPLAGIPLLVASLGRSRPGWGVWGMRVALFAACATLVCLPWLWRNQQTLGSFALRTNLGVELCVGNNDRTQGYFEPSLHPSYSPAEFARYLELGETGYAREARGRALHWIAEHPADFVLLCLRRVQIYWLGDPPPFDPRRDEAGRRAAGDPKSWIKWVFHLGFGALGAAGLVLLARRNAAGWLLFLWAACCPLPYYLTHVLERYRFPIEPLLALGVAAVLVALLERRERARALAPPRALS